MYADTYVSVFVISDALHCCLLFTMKAPKVQASHTCAHNMHYKLRTYIDVRTYIASWLWTAV